MTSTFGHVTVLQNRNWYIGRHFETVNGFGNILSDLLFLKVCTGMVQTYARISLGKQFLEGGPVGPPLCTNESQKYLMHFKC